ncbi:MAG: hypothetical protein KDE34_08080, partial [Anaerolineales bacterium]|nr:hypothetical protein [Anaerolineales bacterium]
MLKRSPILFLLLLSMLACSLPSSFGPTPTPDYAFHATETDEILAQIRSQDLAKIVPADFYARYDCQVSFFRDPDSGGSREQCSYTPYYDFRLDAASPSNKLRFDEFWAATGETFSIELPHEELFT